MSPIEMAKLVLQLRHGLDPEVESFVFRFGSFSLGVQLQSSSEGTSKDSSQLNPNAKVFNNKISAEYLKKQGTKDLKKSIGKSQSKKLTGKANALRILGFKRKLSSLRTQVKKTQGMLDGKENLDQCDFNWTPPSAPEDTLSGIKTHIRHLRRKLTAMCKCLESVSEVGPEEDKPKAELKSMEKDDESKTEKFDEDRRGGAEPEDTKAPLKRIRLWMLQTLAGDEPCLLYTSPSPRD